MLTESLQTYATSEEVQSAINTLSRLEPGPLPYALFAEMAKRMPAPVTEIIPLRKIHGRVQVLLTRRPDTDTVWPGQEHTPGSAMRAADAIFGIPLKPEVKRVLGGELGKAANNLLTYLGQEIRDTRRGGELAHIFYTEVSDETSVGTWYDIDELPWKTIIAHQIPMIISAATAFAQQNGAEMPSKEHRGAYLFHFSPGVQYTFED